jgi:glycosyltransferase involved in cell wall biosynthesis
LKILYHHRVRSNDGQGVHIKELIDALRALGNDVVVVQPGAYKRASFGQEPSTLGWIKRLLPKSVYELLELGYNLPAYFRLSRVHGSAKPDVIYERYSLYLLAGIWLSRHRNIPLILEVNAPLARERARFGGVGLPKLAAQCEKWVWRHADHVLPVTQVLANEVQAASVPSSRITVVANGIDLARFADVADVHTAKARIGLSGKIVLGFVGFMREWHRLDAVLGLLAENGVPRELHLLLVGDGPARATLEHQVRQLGIQSRVTFTGVVNHEAVADFIAAFDIALQPAAVEYASPLKLFEYMALGKAVVAPDQPNIRETLTHEKDALLFEPGNADAMASAIRRLAHDVALRGRLGDAARSTILERHMTWTENARRVSEIAARICAAR